MAWLATQSKLILNQLLLLLSVEILSHRSREFTLLSQYRVVNLSNFSHQRVKRLQQAVSGLGRGCCRREITWGADFFLSCVPLTLTG